MAAAVWSGVASLVCCLSGWPVAFVENLALWGLNRSDLGLSNRSMMGGSAEEAVDRTQFGFDGTVSLREMLLRAAGTWSSAADGVGEELVVGLVEPF